MAESGGSTRASDVEEPLIGNKRDDQEGTGGRKLGFNGARWCMSYAALGSVILLVATFAVLHGGGRGGEGGEPTSLSLDAAALDLDIEEFAESGFQRKFEEAAIRGVRRTSGDDTLTGDFRYSPHPVKGVRLSTRLNFSGEREDAAQRLAKQLVRRRLNGDGLFGSAFIGEYGDVEVDPGSVKLEPVPKPRPSPTPMPPTPAPTPPIPTVEPTQGPTTAPTSSPSPTAEPTPPAPMPDPTTAEPTTLPTTTTPEPAPCPYKFVIKWSLYAGPHNETHFYTTTVPAVAKLIAEQLDWSAESSRIRATHAKKVHKRVSGCFPEQPSFYGDDDDEMLSLMDNAESTEEPALDHHHSHKRKPKVTRGKFEVIFDNHLDGHDFGTWLIGGGGRHMVYRVLADDATLCGARPSCVFVGLWKRRCVEGNISSDTSYDEEDYDDGDDAAGGGQEDVRDVDGGCPGEY
uniref:Uncharacterized protein n=1 Tax=Tetraselmis chuii TaxID=63592 RepID=A0A7S1T0D9_9CHLO|mmetsp:Transcript_38951/g.69775  ORF Transcript_38951/g.69775 Transcript_38951/m.69775 type:complete len:459 (+) Transcript_38951:312-1688(+)